ncbi:MAG TPA: aldo/keto reductase [Flavisolibacter sp.]|nr:aldo/keto reductase [Flavisolibacter sp.]
MQQEQIYTTLNNQQRMPLVGLGVYDMYGKETEEAITRALEIGYRLIDTASMYGNERETGNAIRNSGLNRSEIFLTTKVNNSDHGYDAAVKAFDASMKKLDIEYIDLYLIHWPIKGKRKDTWKALEHLYDTGQVKSIGVANYLLPFLKELETYSHVVPAVNQVEFSPYLYLKDLLQYCKDKKIQLQSYTPLTRGMKFNDPRLLQLAEKYGKSPAQIILRWNVEHGVSTIPKSSNPKRLKENFDIFDFSLAPEDVAFMDEFNEHFRVVDDPMEML